ncbi:MAG: DUF5522 domain-containing protein [Bacteroidota bacterium]|jgi:hypothetical protein
MSFTDKFDPDDYYLSPEGYIIFTEAYHLKRGYCCNSNCKHCPWKDKKVSGTEDQKPIDNNNPNN